MWKNALVSAALMVVCNCYDAQARDVSGAQALLKCFHPTGNYVDHDEGVDLSSIMNPGRKFSIIFSGGFTGWIYEMEVVVRFRKSESGINEFRAEVVKDNTMVGYNKKCQYLLWRPAGS